MEIKYLALLLLILPLAQCTEAQPRLVGGPCEGCEAVFEYGNKKLTPADTLTGFPKTDTPLKITGRGLISLES